MNLGDQFPLSRHFVGQKVKPVETETLSRTNRRDWGSDPAKGINGRRVS